MRTSDVPTLDTLLVSRLAPDGQAVPVLRVAHDGTRTAVTWSSSPEPSLLRVQTPFGALVPEHGRPFLDALERQLKRRPGWTCDRSEAA